MRKPFTLEAGLWVQQENLEFWASVLKPAVFTVLAEAVFEENNKLRPDADGYDVWRGQSLNEFVLNYKANN
jgi:hypothetical protein